MYFAKMTVARVGPGTDGKPRIFNQDEVYSINDLPEGYLAKGWARLLEPTDPEVRARELTRCMRISLEYALEVVASELDAHQPHFTST